MGDADLSRSNEELAAEVVKLPDGVNLMQESGLEALIRGKLEDRDPERYAAIFRIAQDLPEATPWMKLACIIEVLNGRRRDPECKLPILRAWARSECAVAKSGDSASTPAIQGLLGGLCQNLAFVERALRLYYEASLTQMQSAVHYLAAGREEDAMVAMFISAVEGASNAIIEGDVHRAEDAIDHMVAMEELIRRSTDPYPQWMQENAALHIVFAKMKWGCSRETEFCLLENVSSEELDAAYNACNGSLDVPHFGTLLEMALSFDQSEYGDVIELGEEAEEEWSNAKGSGVREALLFMKVLRALAYYQTWRPIEAAHLLHEVVVYDGPDGGMSIAVAARVFFDTFVCHVHGTAEVEE